MGPVGDFLDSKVVGELQLRDKKVILNHLVRNFEKRRTLRGWAPSHQKAMNGRGPTTRSLKDVRSPWLLTTNWDDLP